jgi:hypothetical protein
VSAATRRATANNLTPEDLATVERMTRRIFASNFIERGTINAPTDAAAVEFLKTHAADGGSSNADYHVEWRRSGVTVEVPRAGRSGIIEWPRLARIIRARTLREWTCIRCGVIHENSEQPDRCDVCTWDAIFLAPAVAEVEGERPDASAHTPTSGTQLALFA